MLQLRKPETTGRTELLLHRNGMLAKWQWWVGYVLVLLSQECSGADRWLQSFRRLVSALSLLFLWKIWWEILS